MQHKKDTTRPSPRGSASTEPATPPRPRRSFARWRALCLSLVYLVFAAHIIHWKITGRTLAPLELNEVMYTLELGIITAGFLFMCFLVLGTLIFGRFFCSWACHIMVLQDLCAWILRKLGIRQKPIRSRLLLFVPPLTACYMFVWPQIVRTWQSRALPTFHFRTDSEGWASFVTGNFWRNLPSPPIIVLTFVTCGFIIVYLLGSRTFCTYVCPYGSIFSLADRFAVGRIRVNDKCRQCGACTSVCTSGVRVHDELRLHGMVVNPACLKDLDCISACPQSALRYSFTRPSLFKSLSSGGRFGGQPYDFTIAEELLMAAVFLASVLIFRGLYSRVPFLLSLAFGVILGYIIVVFTRLMRQSSVSIARWELLISGRLTAAGRLFAALAVALFLFVSHCAFVRYHEYLGLVETIAIGRVAPADRDSVAAAALPHLQSADRWGLMHNERVQRGMVDASVQLHRFDDVRRYAQTLLERDPGDAAVRLQWAGALAEQGRLADAEHEYRIIVAQLSEVEPLPPTMALARQAMGALLAREGRFDEAAVELKALLKTDPHKGSVHAELGTVLAELGQFSAAIESLREAVRIDPALAQAHYNLGTLLARDERFEEAIASYRRALTGGLDDADVHNNLGFALMQISQMDEARRHFELAISRDARNAFAHFNLGRLLSAVNDPERAAEQFSLAARLDPSLVRLIPR